MTRRGWLRLGAVPAVIVAMQRGSPHVPGEFAAAQDRDRRVRAVERLVARLQEDVKALPQRRQR
jgi:hypothetical protein